MRTAGPKSNEGSFIGFGSLGSSSFKSATANSTGANARTSFGDGFGLYNAFFTQTNITKLALVSGDGSATDPTSHIHYVVYDLVDTGTGSETLYEIIDRLDTFNKNNPSWHRNDNLYGSPSVTNFTAGTTGYSGLLTSSGGNFTTSPVVCRRDDYDCDYDYDSSANVVPDKICIWGVNRDYDNDVQVLCAYSGNLTSGKGDRWRGENPSQTFWSYWGNDWYRNSTLETISAGVETHPGIATNATGYTGTIYLMAFGATPQPPNAECSTSPTPMP